jgi:C-terminal processing protease CtpA/Prc
MMMNKLLRSAFLLIMVLFALASCKKEEDDTIELVNQEIYELMKVVYLWNTTLPASVNPGSYATPNDFMEELRYDEYDRWSVVITKEEYNQYFEEGIMIGHGFMAGLDEGENIRIALVYPTTQAYEEGIRRGWIVSKINGTVATPANFFELQGEAELGVTNTFTFIDLNGTTINITLSKEEIEISPVVHYEVLEQGTDRIGYLVFQDFIETANEQLDRVFESFHLAGINEIIVDLRYNGGGSVEVAEHLASWLIGRDFADQPLIHYQHNLNLAASEDTTINITGNPAGLSLNRVFFIGTQHTASASELMIKGLEPYVESVLAGSNTHGKPVGMYAFEFRDYDYVVLPVCFKYTNADYEGDFYEGLSPSLPAEDDLTRDFGDPEEASLQAVLNYIETGAVPLKTTRYAGYPARLIESDHAINQYLKAY